MKPLIQIESPESTDGKLIPLNKKAGEYKEYLNKISAILEIPVESPFPLRDLIAQNRFL
jgi:hypothetical protein